MTLTQIMRHVSSHRPDGPSWFERGLMLLAILAVLGFILALTGCWSDPAAMEACRRGCAPQRVAKMGPDGCVCAPACPGDGGAK